MKFLNKARWMFYNIAASVEREANDFKNTLSLPYKPVLEGFANQIRQHKLGYHIASRYSNTIRKKLVHNKPANQNTQTGVYCIPCKDCSKCYIGESGRSLELRKKKHLAACRTGNSYNAVAKHTWEYDHRIDFGNMNLVYKCQNRDVRRVVEGALISLNDTFENNSGLTKEDKFINEIVCKTANIVDYKNISANPFSAASLALPQVADNTMSENGAIRESSTQQLAAIVPVQNHRLPEENNLPPRRSQRIQLMNNRTSYPP